jgi:site-specific DNA-methyltransferase (adenine-specific)
MLHYKFCNKLICLDGVEGMKMLPEQSIPLTVTSPPWDQIRIYGGHLFDFEAMASQLWRVTMEGGVVCWHVADQIKKYTESGTSAEQKLYFRELGFNVNTLVAETAMPSPATRYRYGASVQYVFVLSKGIPQTFHPIKDIANKYIGENRDFIRRSPDGSRNIRSHRTTADYRVRGQVWRYLGGSHFSRDEEAKSHPAIMHEKLAEDLICSWSSDGDVVLDPMSGSGTTAKMALLNNRRYIGFEIHNQYHFNAVKRLQRVTEQFLAVA